MRKLFCLSILYILFCVPGWAITNQNTLSPQSPLIDAGYQVFPRQHFNQYFNGFRGILAFIEEILESEKANEYLIQPLELSNIQLKFRTSDPKGRNEPVQVDIDIFPTSPETIRKIEDEIYFWNFDEYATNTGLRGSSLGRIKLLLVQIDGNTIPVFSEIQPSWSWRHLDKKKLTQNMAEKDWVKTVTQQLANYLTLSGFHSVLARSAQNFKTSVQNYVPQPTPGSKKYVNSIDVKKSYFKPFRNPFFWSTPESVDFGFQPFVLGKEDLETMIRSGEFHQFMDPLETLHRRGLYGFRLEEFRLEKSGQIKTLVVFENPEANVRITWEYQQLIEGLANNPIPANISNIEELTKYLRFNQDKSKRIRPFAVDKIVNESA